jgi:hypothetical protein
MRIDDWKYGMFHNFLMIYQRIKDNSIVPL